MTTLPAKQWYRRIGEPSQSLDSIVWFPHAGAGVSPLIRLARQFPPSVNVFAASLPGREARFGEPNPESLEQLITTLVKEMPAMSRPPVLLGHSFGALLAYCVARRHAASGLIVMAMAPPDTISNHDSIVHLDDLDFVTQLDRRYGGVPQALRENEEAMRLFLPPVRHDLSLLESYQDLETEPLDIPLTAIAGSRDPRADALKMQGWQSRTTGRFVLKKLVGDHFFPLSHFSQVLQLAQQCCG
jgi:surfactin synthase thioesterase subunit